MSQTTKNFLFNLAIVIISAVLSFLVSYVDQHLKPVQVAVIGGGCSTLGVCLKAIRNLA